ncbi:MAG: HAD-IC family P-type ATPase [Clostridiaceae bacterium]|nr:HAD-IC family P-type ATPase [Clostridiaceae bacterium]
MMKNMEAAVNNQDLSGGYAAVETKENAEIFSEMLAEVNLPGEPEACRTVAEELCSHLSTDREPSGFGLSTAVVERLTAEGKINTQTDSNLRTNRQIISENLFTVFNLVNVLLAAAVFLVSLSEPRYLVNLAFIFVAIINTAIGIIQEIRARNMVARLTILTQPTCSVIRDGRVVEIPIHEQVEGDLVFIRSGDQISADGICLGGKGLEMDESLLTGESDSVRKDFGQPLLSGTFAIAGRGLAILTRVGDGTVSARIVAEAKRIKKNPSQIFNALDKLIKIISLTIVPIGILLLGSRLYSRNYLSVSDVIVSTVGALVGMIPEGLVLLTSISFAVGVINMARHRALVQTLPSIETLARVDVLCLDKTGTITTGAMDVLGIYPVYGNDIGSLISREEIERMKTSGTGAETSAVVNAVANTEAGTAASSEISIESGYVTSAATPTAEQRTLPELIGALVAVQPEGNATQEALNAAFATFAPGPERADRLVIKQIPFSSARKWQAVVFADGSSLLLGAAELMLSRNALQLLLPEINRLAAEGMRILTLAYLPEPIDDPSQLPDDPQAIALIAIGDQIRSDAPETFAYFREQQVELKVISGDNPVTVAAVARRAGLTAADTELSYIDMSTVPEEPVGEEPGAALGVSGTHLIAAPPTEEDPDFLPSAMFDFSFLEIFPTPDTAPTAKSALSSSAEDNAETAVLTAAVDEAVDPESDEPASDEPATVEVSNATDEDEAAAIRRTYDDIVAENTVFGRVSPTQKRSLLRALQRNGHTVAMTGDGVNDVLALKEADFSVAMASGAAATRNSADLVLIDNNMSAMIPAVYEGRRIINNIERVATLFLVKTIYSSILSVLFIFLPWRYPIYPVQMTVISSFTIGIPAFILALKSNRDRVKGKFLPKVLRRALPAGVTAVIMIILTQIVSRALEFTPREISTVCVLQFAFVGLVVLWRVSRPINLERLLLWFACAAAIVLAFTLFPDLLNMSNLFTHIYRIYLPAFPLTIIMYRLMQELLLRLFPKFFANHN